MGSGHSTTSERVSITQERENEAFNIVRISEDALRTLRGEKRAGQYGANTEIIVGGDEKLLSALNDEKQLTQRLRQDLMTRQREIKELSDRLSSFEREARNAVSSFGGAMPEKPTDKTKQADRQKMEEILQRERQRQDEAAKQFKESLERLQQRFLKYSCHTACADVESKVLQCYLQNPNEPLRCVNDGDEFLRCVDEYRAKLLTAKEMTVRGGS